jgi:hypothetical protein
MCALNKTGTKRLRENENDESQFIRDSEIGSEGRPSKPISILADLQVKAYENRVRERLMAKHPTCTPTEAKRLEKQIQKIVEIYAEGRTLLQGDPTDCIRHNHHPQGIEAGMFWAGPQAQPVIANSLRFNCDRHPAV